MQGLTNDDVIESLSITYGMPLLLSGRRAGIALPTDVLTNATIVARWEDAESLMVLMRDSYAPQLQLVLLSKPLTARANAAIKEAQRLDAREAPQRELERNKQAVADARVADEKARAANKAAFRP
jgi:hypothetical protein